MALYFDIIEKAEIKGEGMMDKMEQDLIQWGNIKSPQSQRDTYRGATEKRTKRRRKKRRYKKRFIVIAVIMLGLVFGSVLAILSAVPAKERNIVKEIGGIPVNVDLLPEEVPGRPGIKRDVKYIVIHETGNTGVNANAASHNSYLHRTAETETLSWHYTVDDKEIYQHLPDTEVGYHAGDKMVEDGGNMNGIGIEMCVNPENDYEETLKNTAILVKYLMDSYGLSLKDVKKHQDFSGKLCPEQLIKADRWEEFVKQVDQVAYK